MGLERVLNPLSYSATQALDDALIGRFSILPLPTGRIADERRGPHPSRYAH